MARQKKNGGKSSDFSRSVCGTAVAAERLDGRPFSCLLGNARGRWVRCLTIERSSDLSEVPVYPSTRLLALRQAAPDLIHVVMEGPIGLLGRRSTLRRGIALVTPFHTDFPRYAARYLGKWGAYLRRFHGRARQVQTPSEATRSALVQLGIAQTIVWGVWGRGVDTRPAGRHGRAARALAVGRDWSRDRLPTLWPEAMLACTVPSPSRSLLADRPII